MTAQEQVLTDEIANLKRAVDDLREMLRRVILGFRTGASQMPTITERRI